MIGLEHFIVIYNIINKNLTEICQFICKSNDFLGTYIEFCKLFFYCILYIGIFVGFKWLIVVINRGLFLFSLAKGEEYSVLNVNIRKEVINDRDFVKLLNER